jgi:glycine/D-amino acid oxidase-like deaminating enzyme
VNTCSVPHNHVAIVGTGFGGIATAYTLSRSQLCGGRITSPNTLGDRCEGEITAFGAAAGYQHQVRAEAARAGRARSRLPGRPCG